MPRTKGAIDLKPRKKRKSKTKHRIRFKRSKGKKTELKLQIWEKCPMSKQGYEKWNRYIRPHIRRVVFRILMRIDAPVERLKNEDSIKELMLEFVGYEGYFYIMGCSGTLRNSYRVKWVKLAEVQIMQSRNGLIAWIHNKSRLRRYWFWEGS